MNKRVLWVALSATMIIGGCSAAAAQSAAPLSQAAAAAAPSVAPQSLAPAESPVGTIHLSLHPINDTVGSLTGCSSTGSCQGDFMVGYDPLFDVATGKQAGMLAYECFLVDVGSTCTSAITRRWFWSSSSDQTPLRGAEQENTDAGG